MSQSWSILPKTPYQVIGHGERLAHIQALRARRVGYQDRATYGYILPDSYESVYGTGGVYDYFGIMVKRSVIRLLMEIVSCMIV